ncbi:MAG: glucose-1-phosphate adenylyltransferase subunit GlgD [Desulfitobacterium hafniense]|nr:glucose-1-phosphate adenylyltransferase subunit GlgD [Desulfitobacterium hafniense]
MHSVIGLIFGNTRSDILQGLAQDRPIAAVPFGGRYRLLDFALSSMVNSGIRTVGLVTPHHYRPVLDHLGAGKDFSLDRKAGGLFILPGAIHGLIGDKSKFRIKDICLNIEFLQKDFSENVVISYCNQVYNINYRDALEFHNQKQADITLIYKETDDPLDMSGRVILYIGKDQHVHKLQEKYEDDPTEQAQPYFVDMLIIRRTLLLDIIQGYKCIENIDLLDALRDNLTTLKVYGYNFTAYIGRIDSIKDYFDRNMDLFKPEIRKELFLSRDRIHTKIRDNPPTKYGSKAKVSNSLLASGCCIDGEVENSILSRGVVIKPGCMIKNSIIMQKCIIGKNAVLENVILDKFVEVNEGNVLKGSENNPLVLYKKTVV